MAFDPEGRTARELAAVDGRLAPRVRRVLAAMAILGHPMVVIEGLRTVQRQQDLYAQGRTRPGPVVTNVDGVRVKGNHVLGRAADVVFVTADGTSISWTGPWPLFGACAEAVGLVWGGRWPRLRDNPHVELPADG